MFLFRPTVPEKSVVMFFERHLAGVKPEELFAGQKYAKFLAEIQAGREVAATKTYGDINNCSLAEARLATVIANYLTGKGR